MSVLQVKLAKQCRNVNKSRVSMRSSDYTFVTVRQENSALS